jgi:hypothetical protein
LSGIVLLSYPVALRAQEDTVLVEAVVRLDIQGGPAEVLPALAYNSTLLLPLRRFLELAEIPLADYKQDSSAAAVIEPGSIVVRFVPDSGLLAVGDSVLGLEPLEAVWWDSELFVETAVIDRVFGVATRMEWASLSAVVGQTTGLPVVRRTRRERRHALLDRPSHAPLPPFTAPQPETLADGGVVEWSLTSSARDPIDNLSLSLGAGAKVWGGSIELKHRLRNVDGTASSDIRASWSRAWPERRWLRQVRVGDVLSNGLRSRLVRGAVVTNAPFIRSSQFDVEQVLGQLPAGWEVELYERGRLRGYDEVDALGVFRLPLQLRYGQNPFELVLYGPGGEVVRESRTIRVPFSRLPAGALEYAVATGGCRFEPCRGLLSTDVRYGLTSSITVQGGSDYFWRESQGGLWQPYAVASAAVLPSLRVTGEAVYHGHLRGSVGLEPTPDFRLDVSHTLFSEAGSAFNRTLQEDRRTDGSLFWRPHGLTGLLYFQLVAQHSTGPSGTRNFQRLSATARRGRVRYTVGLRHDLFATTGIAGEHRTGVDLSAEAILAGPLSWFRTMFARGVLSADAGDGLSALRATIGRQIAQKIRVDAGLGWLREGGYSLEIGLTTVLAGPRFGSRSRFSTRSGTDGIVFTDGSVVVDPDTRAVLWSDGRDLGRAGIAGIIFIDENGNGVRDAEEVGLEGIPVRVGGWYDETDEAGRFSAWDLFPFEPSSVEVDSLAFDDPRLALPNPIIRVSPTPNSFLSVDVPVVVGAEISGYVLEGYEGLAGFPVSLRNLTTGRTSMLTTFSDGAFYQIGVLPGEYEIGVPEEFLEQIDAAATTLQISIPEGFGDKRIEDMTILVVRAQQP